MSTYTKTMEEINNLKKFGNEFQSKCVAGLLADQGFVERIFDIITPDFFESDANKWVVEQTMEYFIQYKTPPTLNVFKVKIDAVANEVLKKAIVEQLRNVYAHLNATDIPYVKEQFLEFCRNQKLKNAIMSSVDFLKQGQYEQIKH